MKMDLPKQVEKALGLLLAAGFEAFVVGGSVRDLLLAKEPTDFDIATSARPEQTKEVFTEFRLVETGLKHGTVTVLVEGILLEITTYRIDGEYSDNRHPDEVIFTKNLKDDLKRRDFTINAMAFDPVVGLVDFFGGEEDLKNKVVKCVGEPDARFLEDSLRILRALRFASCLGFEIDPATAKSICANKELLQNIAAERIAKEFTLFLCGHKAGELLEQYTDVFGVFLPELLPMKGFCQHNKHHIFDVLIHTTKVVENVDPQPELRLAALFHDIGKPATFSLGPDGVGHFFGHGKKSVELAEAALLRLKFDNATISRVRTLVLYHDADVTADRKIIKRWLNRLGPELLHELLSLKVADVLSHAPNDHYRVAEIKQINALVDEVVAEAQCFSLRNLAVNGRDVLELGIPRGKKVGEILAFLLNEVIEERLANDREVLLTEIKKYLI